MVQSTLDFDSMTQKQINQISETEDVKEKREAFNKIVSSQGLGGFFKEINSGLSADGIDLQYDIEQVKSEIGISKGVIKSPEQISKDSKSFV